jgi:chemotaxis methyl-accepting protein methylase
MNVFEPIDDRFDLVICMHLLVSRYFAQEQIERGIANLAASLAVGGSVVVGATEAFRVIRRVGVSELDERRFR